MLKAVMLHVAETAEAAEKADNENDKVRFLPRARLCRSVPATATITPNMSLPMGSRATWANVFV